MNLFTQLVDGIEERARPLMEEIARLPLPERIEAINRLRVALHEISPFREEPVDCVLWVPAANVEGNDYNPNSVARPELRLLARSIERDGFTQPIVVFDEALGEGRGEIRAVLSENVVVVDGFHRTRVGRENKGISRRLHGYLPVSVIKQGRAGRKDRIAATIRHNRARGRHAVMPMTDVVADLIRLGWTDDEVAAELGMDADEVLRFKHNAGMPELFSDHEYSRAWE